MVWSILCLIQSFHGKYGHLSSLLVVYVGFVSCVCMVGLFVLICLSKLHSWVDSLRLVICSGGRMYPMSLDYVWLGQTLYNYSVYHLCFAMWNWVRSSRLWTSRMLSEWKSFVSLLHSAVVP